jgi:hypothetical protein
MQGMSPILQANPMAAVSLQKHILEHVKIKAEEDVEVDLFKAYGMDPGNMVSDFSSGLFGIRLSALAGLDCVY